MGDQGIEARAALGGVDAGHRPRVGGVRAEPVDGLGGKGDEAAGAEQCRRLGDAGVVRPQHARVAVRWMIARSGCCALQGAVSRVVCWRCPTTALTSAEVRRAARAPRRRPNDLPSARRRHAVHAARGGGARSSGRRRAGAGDRRRHGRRHSRGGGEVRSRRHRAAQPRGRQGRVRVRRRRGHHAPGLEGGVHGLGWRRLERPHGRSPIRRPGPAAPRAGGVLGDLERGRLCLRARAPADGGGRRGADPARVARTAAPLSAQARLRRVDGHDEPHRAAGGLRPQRPARPRRAGRRRQLPHLRAEDLHHLWRARPHGQHPPPRAGASARRTAGDARHLAVPRSEGAGERRRDARRAATTCAATRWSTSSASTPRPPAP